MDEYFYLEIEEYCNADICECCGQPSIDRLGACPCDIDTCPRCLNSELEA